MVNLEELKEVLLISDDSPSGLVWKIDKFCDANYQIPIAKVGDVVMVSPYPCSENNFK